jgi:site-specific recombinase XerD
MTSALQTDTFFEYIKSFTDYRTTVYEASNQTMVSNLTDISLFKNFVADNHYGQINGNVVMEFQMYLKKNRGNCGTSINRKLFSLRSYSSHLKLLEIDGAEELPFQNVLKIRGGYKSDPQALTTGQIQLLFSQIDRTTCLGLRNYCVYAFMYNLGLRIGEVHGLDLNDVDIKKKQITVTGKGKKKRSLHLTDEIIMIIEEYLAVRSVFLNIESESSFFKSKKGKRLSIRTMEDNFKKIIENSDLNVHFNVTCHTLRHSFASHLNDKDVDILVLQSLLGHSSPRSTEIYIHPSLQRQRDALENLSGVKFLNKLFKAGAVKIKFQRTQKVKVIVDSEKLKSVLLI